MSSEWFDIYNDEGKHIGQAPRDEVHRLGHWHITFHCWLYELREEVPFVIFQRRQQGKDTNPLCYDITVAGHLSAGEQLQDAVREIEEEIGIITSFEQLVHIMDIKEEARGISNSKPYWDRELSHVFALRNPAPINTWRLQEDEVQAVYAAPLQQLRALFSEQIAQLEVSGYVMAEHAAHRGHHKLTSDYQTIQIQQFVPRERTYYLNVLNAIEKMSMQN